MVTRLRYGAKRNIMVRGSRRWFKRRLSVAAMAVVLGAVPAAVAAPLSVTFSLENRAEGPAALFFLALDKGYFAAEGLDVKIEPAGQARDPIERVAGGDYP